jgi:predicted RNA-binding protein with PIN domain
MSSRPLVVVDAANVIGSRPDGWWRDRAGAARRLVERLASEPVLDGDLVVILEGAARRGVEAGAFDGIQIVHAPRSGDDTIVDVVREARSAEPQRRIIVVTADRGLRQRVEQLGADTVGPHALRTTGARNSD